MAFSLTLAVASLYRRVAAAALVRHFSECRKRAGEQTRSARRVECISR